MAVWLRISRGINETSNIWKSPLTGFMIKLLWKEANPLGPYCVPQMKKNLYSLCKAIHRLRTGWAWRQALLSQSKLKKLKCRFRNSHEIFLILVRCRDFLCENPGWSLPSVRRGKYTPSKTWIFLWVDLWPHLYILRHLAEPMSSFRNKIGH